MLTVRRRRFRRSTSVSAMRLTYLLFCLTAAIHAHTQAHDGQPPSAAPAVSRDDVKQAGPTSEPSLSDHTVHLTLRDGFVTHNVKVLPAFPETISNVSDVKVLPVVIDGASVLTSVRVVAVSPVSPNSLTAEVEATFDSLPGAARLSIAVSYRGVTRLSTFLFNVIGVVIYRRPHDGSSHKLIRFTGKSAADLVLDNHPSNDSVHTLNAGVFSGSVDLTHSLSVQKIELRPPADSVLTWDPTNCRITASKDTLTRSCSMAFSRDFQNFYIRRPPGSGSRITGDIRIEWIGLRGYENHVHDETGFDPQQAGENDQPGSAKDDIITTLRVSDHASDSSGLQVGLIVLIVVVTLVLIVACALLAVFCMRHEKPGLLHGLGLKEEDHPDGPALPSTTGGLFALATQALNIIPGANNNSPVYGQNATGDAFEYRASDVGKTTVEPHVGSAGESVTVPVDYPYVAGGSVYDEGSTREGIEIPTADLGLDAPDEALHMDRRSKNRSIAPLQIVRRSCVVRGVALEPSTDGGSMATGRDNAATDTVTSGGMTSTVDGGGETVQLRDGGSADEAVARGHGERAVVVARHSPPGGPRQQGLQNEGVQNAYDARRGQGRGAAAAAAARSRARGVDGWDRAGVDAAIDRVRQVDLLLGPASRGLVGRFGEPLPQSPPDGGAGTGARGSASLKSGIPSLSATT